MSLPTPHFKLSDHQILMRSFKLDLIKSAIKFFFLNYLFLYMSSPEVNKGTYEGVKTVELYKRVWSKFDKYAIFCG
jgi:hypothetical protein